MKRIFLIAVVLLIPFSAWADFDLPVNGPVTSGMGWRLDPFGSGRLVYHRGIDIAVPVGTQVRAVRAGRVIFAGVHGGHGATVIIEHDNGDRTLYGHNSSLSVRAGERVGAGTVIALSGNSGRSTGPHVHFEQLAGGRFPVAVAQTDEAPPPAVSPDRELRRRQERRIDDVMDSILNNIRGGSSLSSGTTAQGG